MRIPPDSVLRRHPWTWLLKAVLAGGVPTLLVALFFGARDPRLLAESAGVGALYAVVIWGGYECCSEWLEAHPASSTPYQAALLIAGKWLLLYLALVGLCLVLMRSLFGINGLQDRAGAFFTVFVGLIISGSIVNLRATTRNIATARALEQARAQAAFLALKAQLSPHTLFNALNTIASLIPEDPKGAERAVERLSALLRRILGALERERWSLAEEFGLLADLLEIQQARYGARLAYELLLPAGDEDRAVPPLLLLPLVENALKHGFGPKVGSCRLRVRVEGDVVRVEDDGVGRRPGAPDGVGLRTVRQRVEAMGGRLEWPAVDEGCVAEVRLCP